MKRTPYSSLDKEFSTGVFIPKADEHDYDSSESSAILHRFEEVLGSSNISADPSRNKHYRRGWRSGEGEALAVLFPQTLTDLWTVLKIAVSENLTIIMQAANTGLTEGSTPSGEDYTRPVVVINTLAIDDIILLNQGEQALAFPGATLHSLESRLSAIGRAPHSVIGSSCLGASIVGGIANNSGGALVKRGPAYTELSVFARVNLTGELELINHSGIDLGDDADSVIKNLQQQSFDKNPKCPEDRLASDCEYIHRIKQVDADTPSRFNADPRRLYEASGCAGKIAVFAVRVDTHPVAKLERTFYVGTNDPYQLYLLRRRLLSELPSVPEVGEYMHREMFNVSERYGKDTFLSVLRLGTQRLPKLFAVKGRVDSFLSQFRWLPRHLSDRVMQFLSTLSGQHLPHRMLEYRDLYEHHLIIKLSDESIEPGKAILTQVFSESSQGQFFECDTNEGQRAFLNRFAAAGAAMRYQMLHHKKVGEILALDIALKRNELNWVESLPAEISQYIEKPLYYGHFFCYVFHQDYILKRGADPEKVKKLLLALLDARGAKYPAEHNVGHLYHADDAMETFYQSLDPNNMFNPGVGKLSKLRRNCSCGTVI